MIDSYALTKFLFYELQSDWKFKYTKTQFLKNFGKEFTEDAFNIDYEPLLNETMMHYILNDKELEQSGIFEAF